MSILNIKIIPIDILRIWCGYGLKNLSSVNHLFPTFLILKLGFTESLLKSCKQFLKWKCNSKNSEIENENFQPKFVKMLNHRITQHIIILTLRFCHDFCRSTRIFAKVHFHVKGTKTPILSILRLRWALFPNHIKFDPTAPTQYIFTIKKKTIHLEQTNLWKLYT